MSDWITLLAPGQRVEVRGGAYDGQHGSVRMIVLDLPSYLIALDSGQAERFAHDELIELEEPRDPRFAAEINIEH